MDVRARGRGAARRLEQSGLDGSGAGNSTVGIHLLTTVRPRSVGWSMMRSTSALISLMSLSAAVHAQTPVKFCDLLRNPEKYRDQQVKVRATFRYGFEWQQLYCLDCLDKGRAWLWLPDEMDDESTRTFKKMPKGAGMVNLTVVGVLHFGGSYGHRNGYRYELIAQEIRDVAVIRKGTKGPATESKLEQLWACGGTNPK